MRAGVTLYIHITGTDSPRNQGTEQGTGRMAVWVLKYWQCQRLTFAFRLTLQPSLPRLLHSMFQLTIVGLTSAVSMFVRHEMMSIPLNAGL